MISYMMSYPALHRAWFDYKKTNQIDPVEGVISFTAGYNAYNCSSPKIYSIELNRFKASDRFNSGTFNEEFFKAGWEAAMGAK